MLHRRYRDFRRSVRRLVGPRSTPRVIFFHTPKCGGTSVEHAIRESLHARHPLRSIPVFHLDAFASHRASRALCLPVAELREQILLYSLGLRHLALIGGHFPLSDAALALKAPQDVFVSVLRDPRSRLLSEYFYNRFKAGDRTIAIEIDLEPWLDSEGARPSGTTLVRTFCGDPRFAAGEAATVPDADWQEAARRAVANLRRLDVVGDISRLPAFADAFRERTGLTLSVGHKMRSPKPSYAKFAEQPEPVRRKIEDLCRTDLEVYEAVRPAMA